MRQKSKDTDKNVEQTSIHWTEKFAGGISALLVFLLISWVIYDVFRYEVQNADFLVKVVSVTKSNAGSRVLFDVINLTSKSAAKVSIVGKVTDKNGVEEESNTVFDYVASESQSRGALFFSSDPKDGDLRLSVKSYIDP